MAQPKRKDKVDDKEATAAPADQNPAQPVGPDDWARPAKLSRLSLGVLLAVIALFNLPILHYFLFRGAAPTSATVPYSTDFADPAVVDRDFFSTGGQWRSVNGELLSPGVKNNPLWLKAKLPQNVAVEFDVRSMSPEGDIKCEIFGDGTDHASGYVLIHGGWNNSLSIIARLDEHGQPWGAVTSEAARLAREKGMTDADVVKTGAFRADTRTRVELTGARPVQIGRMYHWRIERRNDTIVWYLDGQEYGRFQDPLPLVGEGHDRFGFSSWEAQLFFDNLKIEPL